MRREFKPRVRRRREKPAPATRLRPHGPGAGSGPEVDEELLRRIEALVGAATSHDRAESQR